MNPSLLIAARRALLGAIVVFASGCAMVAKVDSGDQVVAQRLKLQLDGAWNELKQPVVPNAVTWTIDGITVDQLSFYVGIKDGAVLAPPLSGAKEARPLTFKASMQPHEVMALVQTLLTRDGSTYTEGRLEPIEFLGGRGFRSEYGLIRKSDEVRMAGVVYGAVQGSELFLIHYTAPRLGFYPRHAAQIEKMARGARLGKS